MEVTSVSPSATSPTEGDDLCEIDGSNVAIHSVTLLFSLCGLVGNGAVLCLVHLKAGYVRIFDLALIDFVFLLFTVPSALLFLVEEVSCSHIVPQLYLSFLFQLSRVSYYCVLFRLFRIRTVVYMYKRCCHSNLPERLLFLVGSVELWAIFTLFTVIPTVALQCPSHHQEHCRAAVISMYTTILLLLVVPGVISLTINLLQPKRGPKKKQPKRLDIVTFLMALFFLLLSLGNLLQLLGYTFVSSQVVFLLNCIYNSIKPFIYFLAGKGWRPCSMRSLQLSLQRFLDESEENTAHINDATEQTLV